MWKRALAFAILAAVPVAAPAQKQITVMLHWISDSNGCKVWDSEPSANESVTWTGPCKDGYADGKGTLTWYVKGKPYGTYEGEMKGGHYDGNGTQVWPTGSRYDGAWKNDRADGPGIYRSVQGEVCDGQWVEGCFQGAGCNHSVGVRDCPTGIPPSILTPPHLK